MHTNATFNTISSFTQINTTHAIVADSYNGCLRMVDRTTNQTQRLAGTCVAEKFKVPHHDGSLLSASFHMLGGLAYENGIIYVTETQEQSVRKIDIPNNLVTTIFNTTNFINSIHKPEELVFTPSGDLIVSFRGGLGLISLADNSFSYLTSQEKIITAGGRYRDGPLLNSLWDWPHGMTFLTNTTLLVADMNNHMLRIVDFESANVSSWCIFDVAKRRPGGKGWECQLTKPYALRRINRDIYITHAYGLIGYVDLPVWVDADFNYVGLLGRAQERKFASGTEEDNRNDSDNFSIIG